MPVRAFDEKVLPLRSCCQLPMKAEVRLGASCIWSMETLPSDVLPTVAAEVEPDSVACSPDSPPTSAVPKFSILFKAAQATNGMLIARYPTMASPDSARE